MGCTSDNRLGRAKHVRRCPGATQERRGKPSHKPPPNPAPIAKLGGQGHEPDPSLGSRHLTSSCVCCAGLRGEDQACVGQDPEVLASAYGRSGVLGVSWESSPLLLHVEIQGASGPEPCMHKHMHVCVCVCTRVCKCAQELVGVQGPAEALDSSARWPEARLCPGRGQTQRGAAAGGGGSPKVAPEKQLGTEERSQAGTQQLSRDLGRVQP